MEPTKPHEDLFLKSYQIFKSKHISKISLHNMIQHIIDKSNIEPNVLPNMQDNPPIEPLPISYKRPRYMSPIVPPKVK